MRPLRATRRGEACDRGRRMKKLGLVTLAAASAAFAAVPAQAQHHGRSGSGSSFGSSSSSGSSSGSSSSSSSGSSFRSSSSSNIMVQHSGGFSHGGGFVGGMHPGPNFRHHRLQRGFMVHPFWFGPQFHVQNWQLYGFGAPRRDQRWVRYYDDA